MFITVFALVFFHPTVLARMPNLEKNSIYSNKFFHNFQLSESSFTCPGLRASGLHVCSNSVYHMFIWCLSYICSNSVYHMFIWCLSYISYVYCYTIYWFGCLCSLILLFITYLYFISNTWLQCIYFYRAIMVVIVW